MPTQEQITAEYTTSYQQKLVELGYAAAGDSQKVEIERDAQKAAIKNIALQHLRDTSTQDKAVVWNMIYAAHVARKAGILVTPQAIEKVISADQSWKKSSGHAFEEVVKELTNGALQGTGIEILLQRDLSVLIALGGLRNELQDITWLKEQIEGGVFDLFAVKDGIVFGCLQTKTSIRDRVTRDREPSRNAMSRYFWSVAFVLDGDFFRLPKFKAMVNGGTVEFQENGWHSVYVFSLPSTAAGDRIFVADSTLSNFKANAIKAATDWFGSGRQWMTPSWRP